ncbi:MAG TPA: carboxypeptidase-like regulatory domain-containing protein, partial [Pyrinomonadaceae bacterium]|nr:carboxypeptidase-like regulatory domain-containing protein [Pyrinomonadaceae bacterium]
MATGRGGGDCGFGFVIGQRYLVYAYRSAKSDRLTTGICSRTKPYEKAGEDLLFLGTLPSLAHGVTIYGEVTRELRSVKEGNSKAARPLTNMALIIQGEGERKEVRTDDYGRYRLNGLSPGKYEVTLLLPDELTTYEPKREITIADRGCAGVNYHLTDNGRLSGRVFDAEGQPAAKVLLTLIEADAQDIAHDYSMFE